MSVRFRIRTPGGQELSFASHEMFEDFVRSGELSPGDLVYDRDTGSWSPARTHPRVLEIQYEQEAESEADAGGADAPDPSTSLDTVAAAGAAASSEPDTPSGPTEPSQAPAGEEAADGDGVAGGGPAPEPEGILDMADELGLELSLHEEESAEEAKRRLIEKLEAEREAELDPGSLRDSLAGFMVDSSSAELIRTERPGERPPPPPEPKPRPSPPKPESRRPPRSTSPALAGRGTQSSRPAPAAGRGRPQAAKKKGGLGGFLFLIVLVGVVAGAAWTAYQFLEGGPEREPPAQEPTVETEVEPAGVPGPTVPGPTLPEPTVPEADPSEAGPTPSETAAGSGGAATPEAGAAGATPEPSIPSTPAAVRERAQERYLASTQALFRDLEPVPEVWPDGPYLSTPTDHSEVVDVWQHYRTTIRDVRASDAERYEAAYEAALDDAGVQGEDRAARLETAMTDFEASAPARQDHYDRVEALATAAIQSHNALVDAEGLILWDATGSTGGGGLGSGVSGRDAESQLLLDQVVELLSAALDADGEGPGAAENVRAWVWDGFLDAVTR